MIKSMTFKNNKIPHLIKELDKANGSMLEWGIFSDSGTHTVAEMPIANLMAIHEYRQDAWRRPLFHIQAAKVADGYRSRTLITQLTSWITNAASGRTTHIETYTGKFGSALVKDAKELFGRKGTSYKGMTIPQNTVSWGEVKGHRNPLYDTGQMKNAVKFKTYKNRSK